MLFQLDIQQTKQNFLSCKQIKVVSFVLESLQYGNDGFMGGKSAATYSKE